MKRFGCMVVVLGLLVCVASAQTETKPETPAGVDKPVQPAEPAKPAEPVEKEDPNKVVVTVNGKEIKLIDIDKVFDQMTEKDQRFQKLPPEQQKNIRIQYRKATASMLVEIMLLEEAAKEMGIEVTEKDINDFVQGNLNHHIQVGSRGLTLEEFKKDFEINQGVTLDQAVQSQVVNPRTKMQVIQFKMVDKKGSEKLEIKEEDLNARYEEQKARFDFPELVCARHILLSFRDVVAEEQRKMNDEIRKMMDENKPEEGKELTEEQKAEIEKKKEGIEAAGEKKIEELKAGMLTKIKELEAKAKAEGAKFEDIAKEHSDCPSKDKGGYLQYFGREQMVAPFSEAAFSMKPGEISEPVETQFGYHVIKVEDHKAARSAPAEVAKKALRYEMTNQKRGELWRELFGDGYVQELKSKADIQYKDPSLQPPKPRVPSPRQVPPPPAPKKPIKADEQPKKEAPKAPAPPKPVEK